jgi:hypothetical protein
MITMAMNDPVAVVAPEQVAKLHHDQLNEAYLKGITDCRRIVEQFVTDPHLMLRIRKLMEGLYC